MAPRTMKWAFRGAHIRTHPSVCAQCDAQTPLKRAFASHPHIASHVRM